MSRRKNSYRVSEISGSECTLTHYRDEDGETTDYDGAPITPRAITYWAPSGGGYVRDITDQPGTLGQQICRGLVHRGETLYWTPGYSSLATIIRREARAYYRELDAGRSY